LSGVAWETVAREFAFDGSWRDIYVFDAGVEGWQSVLDRLRQARYELVYRDAGEVRELPAVAADAFPADGRADRTLSVKFEGVLAYAHFFTPDEIEFDVDPGAIGGQKQLDALLAFMRLLSDATNRDAVLTPENCREIVVFRTRPNQSAVEYREFGGWRATE
jgi:hypothetical protein